MRSFFISSIGQKFIMGLSGLGMILFLLVHMLGNLLIFAGPKVYNLYAHQMTQDWVIILELGLVLLFISHIILALILSVKNYFSRKIGYAVKPQGWKATPLYQRTLLAQGAVILVFVILHLITFKFGTYYEVSYDGKLVRDLFRLVVELFQQPLVLFWYLVALSVLFFHLLHGWDSSFKSLGMERRSIQVGLKWMGWFYVSFVVLGYMSQPLYVFFIL